MMRRVAWLAVPVAAIAALAMAPAMARAAAAPGWRVVQVLPNATVDGITALGAADAWLAGDSCADSQCDRDTVIVRHWDGKAWRAVTPPAAFIDSPTSQGAGPVAATSASNAWVFAYGGADSVDYTDALHWTGKGWAAAPVGLDMMVEAAVAPAATDVWAFGSPEASTPSGYVAHFNGKTWTQGAFPITGNIASALSPSDIWVAGSANGQLGPALRIEQWNGRAWRNTPLPDLGIGAGTPAIIAGIAAVAPGDVWADVAVLYPPCAAQAGGAVAGESCDVRADRGAANSSGTDPANTYLLHWNGTAWTRVAFPYPGMAETSVVPDGHGGIWLTVDVVSGSSSTLWFCHDSDGRWSRTAVPTEGGQQPNVLFLSWIPGTRSLWAAGTDMADNGSSILKYGS